MNCGGAGLVGYSDSSEEEEGGGGEGKEEDGRSPPRKKQHRSGKSTAVVTATPHTTLPLPSAILEMFSEEVSLSHELQACITALHNYLQTTFAPCVGSPQFHMMQLSDSHISLSRTVAIQHHWIDPLTDALRDKFRRRQGFTLGFSDLTFYCNDEKTRPFPPPVLHRFQYETPYFILEAMNYWRWERPGNKASAFLCSLVEDVDECFVKYSLQEFYEEPSFHMSVFWCLENILPKISEERRLVLQDHWQSLLLEHNLLSGHGSAECYEVTELRCKTGNKIFSFPLTA